VFDNEPAVTVVVLVHGHRRYFRAAREAIRSILAHTSFPITVAVGPGAGRLWLRSPRIRRIRLREPAGTGRAAGFLLKFRALAAALDGATASHVLLLDADAVLAGPLAVTDLVDALGDRPIGMVEQTCIRGGDMDGTRLRAFAYETMLPFFGPVPAGLAAEDLTYYNSGVVIAVREEIADLTAWALDTIAGCERSHDVGEHMVGDQDYFQYWVNVLHPGRCASLPWVWNHCEHWDEGFPRPGARILHFSNFCHGPRRETARRMRAAWVGGGRP
jgi:GT2 family glycosyltransferase